MRKLTGLTVIFLIFIHTISCYAEGGQAEKNSAIIVLKPKTSERESAEMIQKYPSVQIRHEYKHALRGFSVFGLKKELELLKKEKNVQYVAEVKQYLPALDQSVPFIGGEDIRGYYDLKNRRLTGRGVKVGVIDTGIDYTHPDLKNSYKGGEDLVDHDHDPMETKSPQQLATVHGTHVAGIIAANGKLKGVAPEAEIYAYRALGPGGSGDTEQVLLALETAIKDEIDVLNLSLGNAVNGPDLPISMALNKAVEKGIVAVTSNGNSGPGIWTVGSPGTAEKAISVGASTPPLKVPYLRYGLGSSESEVPLSQLQGSKPWDLHFSEELVFGGRGEKSDLGNAQGKVVLIERGKLTFTEKVKNAKEAGAAAVIIYNNTDGEFTGTIGEGIGIPAASITKYEGKKLRGWIKKSVSPSGKYIYKEERDLLADFSSRGPVTVNWGIKPDVVAPGVAINSTVPSGYQALAGTSMAAPHVAGACALILQMHPEWTPEQVKSALMNTAKPITDKEGKLYHTFDQGAGRIQIPEAVNVSTLLSPSSLAFGMYTRKGGIEEHEKVITVENVSESEQHYSFKQPLKEKGLTWHLPASFHLKPGEKKEVKIGLQAESKETEKGIYDGYVTLSEGTKKLQLPYLYVKEEPDYPRVMGFEFVQADEPGKYRYEMYLPQGADEYGIALYEADGYRFAGYLEWGKAAPRGMISKDVNSEKLPRPGLYKAVIFAKRAGKEDRIETTIQIEAEK
ncbi:S8 family serine peptidase [Bacillus massiliglaciei]|uniref:S8 family serine peptidase n=1 Tax=Bacillus massiliglaciei TaxID=1816693 RepID=UPI000B2F7489|nr:S8 family serine peptidase [Bacillus massiliglaciei]